MYDRETDTLWTHVDGRAVRGPLNGQRLQIVPAVHATWKEWAALYPRSQVLKKRGELRSAYEDYNRSSRELGIMGRRNAERSPPLAHASRVGGNGTRVPSSPFPHSGRREPRLREPFQVTGIVDIAPFLKARDRQSQAGCSLERLTEDVTGVPIDSMKELRVQPIQTDQVIAAVWRRAQHDAIGGIVQGRHSGLQASIRKIWKVGADEDHRAVASLERVFECVYEAVAERRSTLTEDLTASANNVLHGASLAGRFARDQVVGCRHRANDIPRVFEESAS